MTDNKDALREALVRISTLRPAGDINECVGTKKLVEKMEIIALGALVRASKRNSPCPFVERLAALTDTECDFQDGIAGFRDGFELRAAARTALSAPNVAGEPDEIETDRLRADARFLRRQIDKDGAMESTMVRAGLLRDILDALLSTREECWMCNDTGLVNDDPCDAGCKPSTPQPESDRLTKARERVTDQAVTDSVKAMVDRFLSWKLPENFNPDGGVTFDRVANLGTEHQYYREPIGTNLLDATQAEAMVRHMIDGLPAATCNDSLQVALAEAIEALKNILDKSSWATSFHDGVDCELWPELARAAQVVAKHGERS